MTNEEFQKIVIKKFENLEGDIKGLKEDVGSLKEDVSTLKEDVSGLKEDVRTLKNDVSSLKDGQNRLEKKMDAVYEQTAVLTEFRTETNLKFDTVIEEIKGMRKDLSTVEIVTANNYADIARLKAVK